MKIQITVKQIPEELSGEQKIDSMILNVDGDKDIYEWIPVLKQILEYITFEKETIEKIFIEEEII